MPGNCFLYFPKWVSALLASCGSWQKNQIKKKWVRSGSLQVVLRFSAMAWHHRSTMSVNCCEAVLLESCSYEDVFILLSVVVYTTITLKRQLDSDTYQSLCYALNSYWFQCLSTPCLLSSASWQELIILLSIVFVQDQNLKC